MTSLALLFSIALAVRTLIGFLVLLIRWRTQLLASFHPDFVQFILDLLSALCPLLDLRQPLAEFCELLFNSRFLAFCADALEIPFFAMGAQAES